MLKRKHCPECGGAKYFVDADAKTDQVMITCCECHEKKLNAQEQKKEVLDDSKHEHKF